MPLIHNPWFQASGKVANNTGPITNSVKKAAVEFFKANPKDNKCWISEGERVSDIFICNMGGQQLELDRDSVGM